MGALGLFILLGLIQGLTEFLPVSSSGHLVLAREYLPGGNALAQDASVEVLLHLGTLLAVLAYYRREVFGLAAGALGRGPEPGAQRQLLVWLVLASLPAGILGVAFESRIESAFAVPDFASAMLLVTAAILALSARCGTEGRKLQDIGAGTAFLIGCAQAVAILPGVSRSGSTIVAGLALGLSVQTAATFSFLLSIPAVAGAIVLKSPELLHEGVAEPAAAIAGVLVSGAVGFASLGFLAFIGRSRRLWWFSPYCAALGIAGLLAGAFGLSASP